MNTPPIISIAPMMGYTDRHNRYFLRLLAPHIRLYTEMITTQAILRGDAKQLLAFHPAEKYLALQLGGSEPHSLAECAKMAEFAGFDEVNLNVGCPSSRVKNGQFGACLMLTPERVAECVATMQKSVKIPVTVKCRIGVDHQDTDTSLPYFINLLASAGCQTFIIHARKAWLKGLSPKENRDIPPLDYSLVHRMKAIFPHVNIILNGGIKNLTDISTQLDFVDGVMIGRAACFNPYYLAQIEAHFFSSQAVLSRSEIVRKMFPYIRDALKNKIRLSAITRHLLGLYHHQKGAALWRRYLSEHSYQANASIEVIEKALHLVETG